MSDEKYKELQNQKDLTTETVGNLKEVIDWDNVDAGEAALKKKDILLEDAYKEIARVKEKFYRVHGELTDTKTQLQQMTESKNRYQKEYMRANKTIVEHKQREDKPENAFANDLVEKIRGLKNINSNPWKKDK